MIEYLPVIAPGLDRDAFLPALQATIETACERLYGEAIAEDPTLSPALQRVAGTALPRAGR